MAATPARSVVQYGLEVQNLGEKQTLLYPTDVSTVIGVLSCDSAAADWRNVSECVKQQMEQR